MPDLILDISVSLDGYVAGPNPDLDDPLGKGGEQLHEWIFGTRAWREAHGLDGGEDSADSVMAAELIEQASATIMGRHMFSGGSGSWDTDPRANGWWGDDPPFHHPVYVLTSHEREPLEMEGGTTFHFVTDGVQSAYDQAIAAAGGKDVQVHGGGSAVSQFLRAGLLDELTVHVAPVFLGSGARLLDDVPAGRLERLNTLASDTGVVHVSYRVVK